MSFFQGLYELSIDFMRAVGPLGFFIVMVLQAVIAPIPSEAVLMLGGATYGLFISVTLGFLGEMIGALWAFYASKKLGRPVVERFVGRDNLVFADKWFSKYGSFAILLGRIIPFIPFDAISYGAGLTKIKLKKFIIATGAGAVPRTFFYCFLGWLTAQHVQTEGFKATFQTLMLLIAFILIVIFLTQRFLMKRITKNK